MICLLPAREPSIKDLGNLPRIEELSYWLCGFYSSRRRPAGAQDRAQQEACVVELRREFIDQHLRSRLRWLGIGRMLCLYGTSSYGSGCQPCEGGDVGVRAQPDH